MPSSSRTTVINILLKNSQLVSFTITFDTEKSLLDQFRKSLKDFGDLKLSLTYIDVNGQPRLIRAASEIPEIIASGAVPFFFKADSLLTRIETEVPEENQESPEEEVQQLEEFDYEDDLFCQESRFGPDFGFRGNRGFGGRGHGMTGPEAHFGGRGNPRIGFEDFSSDMAGLDCGGPTFGFDDCRGFGGRGRGIGGAVGRGCRFVGRMDWPWSDFSGRGCSRGGRGASRGFGAHRGESFPSRGRGSHSFIY